MRGASGLMIEFTPGKPKKYAASPAVAAEALTELVSELSGE
jgi:hypothetical protein